MKKGQVSMFIILGVFILGGTLLVMNLRSAEQDTRDGVEDATPLQDSLLRSIDVCVQGYLDSMLHALFTQGGILYEEDGGLFNSSDFRTELYNNRSVLYGVLNGSDGYDVPLNFKPYGLPDFFSNVDGLFTELSPGTIYAAPSGLFNRQGFKSLPFFGTNQLLPLCERHGPNGVNVSNTAFSCHTSVYGEGNTVQSQLNRALSQRIRSCMENPSLQERYSLRTSGSGNVSVVFGEQDILVEADLSISYTHSRSERTIPVLRLSYPYRVKHIYTLGFLMAQQDTRDIFFEKNTSYQNLTGCRISGSARCWDERIIVTVERNVSGYDDLVIIQDRATRLETLRAADQFLTFQFFVENRRPYLDYISNKTVGTADGTFEILNIPLVVRDPDEEEITIRSIRRKQNEHGAYINPQYYYPLTGEWISEPDIDELVLQPGQDINITCEDYCHLVPSSPPPFQEYYRTRHFFIAEIEDREGLRDYQIFSVTINP